MNKKEITQEVLDFYEYGDLEDIVSLLMQMGFLGLDDFQYLAERLKYWGFVDESGKFIEADQGGKNE